MAERIEIGAPAWVATQLRDRIVAGGLPPGGPVREVAVAEELGVSRNTLREALRILSAESLVVIQRHKGAVVKVMSTEDIRDIYVVRRTIELRAVEESGQASAWALRRLEEAAQSVDASAAQGDWRDVATTGLRFHQAIVGLLGSPRLDAIFVPMVAQIRLAYAAVPDQAGFQGPFAARDREICDLIVAGSRAAAAAALRTYLDDAERTVADVVRQSGSAVEA